MRRVSFPAAVLCVMVSLCDARDARADDAPPASTGTDAGANTGADAGTNTGANEGANAGANASAADAQDTPSRMPPIEVAPESYSLPWERHLELGGDLAFVLRPASVDWNGKPTRIRYLPAFGFGVHGRWDVLRYLRFSAYVLAARHELLLPEGALGQSGDLSVDSVKTYAFGARIAPTLPWSWRARSWVSAGVGWGRMSVGRMTVTEPAGSFFVRERAASFVEIPLGIGTSFDIIPRWLSIELEVTGAFVFGQEGEAIRNSQAIDALGKKRTITGFPVFDGSFVQTIGLSLIL